MDTNDIITKKNRISSYYAFDLKQTLGYLSGDYNATAQYSGKKFSLQLFGGYKMNDYDNAGSQSVETYHFSDRNIGRYSQTITDKKRNDNQYVQLNLKSVEEKRTLGAKLFFVHNKKPNNQLIQQISYSNLNGQNVENNALIEEDSYKPTLELYGDFKLQNNQYFSVNINSSYNKNTYSRNYREEDFYFDTDADEKFYNTLLTLNYSKQVNSNIFSFSLWDNYMLSKSDYTGTLDYSQELYTNEAILRLGYFHNFGSKLILNTQLGGSLLNYQLKGEDEEIRFTPRANIMLRYVPNQRQALTMQFNAGNSFPTISSLNNVEQAVNSILIKKGNPNLDMTNLYNTALMYNLFFKKVNIQAMLINNIFTNLTMPQYYVEGDKLVSTFASNTDFYQYISVLSGTFNVIDNFDIKTELAILHTLFKGDYTEQNTAFRAVLDLNYTWKNLMFNLYVKAKEKQLTNSAVYERNFINYGGNIRWSITNWHVEIGTTNPFAKSNMMKQTYFNPVYNYINETYDRSFQQAGYIKLIYRFGRGKKQKIESTTVDMNMNSAIMKVQ